MKLKTWFIFVEMKSAPGTIQYYAETHEEEQAFAFVSELARRGSRAVISETLLGRGQSVLNFKVS